MDSMEAILKHGGTFSQPCTQHQPSPTSTLACAQGCCMGQNLCTTGCGAWSTHSLWKGVGVLQTHRLACQVCQHSQPAHTSHQHVASLQPTQTIARTHPGSLHRKLHSAPLMPCTVVQLHRRPSRQASHARTRGKGMDGCMGYTHTHTHDCGQVHRVLRPVPAPRLSARVPM